MITERVDGPEDLCAEAAFVLDVERFVNVANMDAQAARLAKHFEAIAAGEVVHSALLLVFILMLVELGRVVQAAYKIGHFKGTPRRNNLTVAAATSNSPRQYIRGEYKHLRNQASGNIDILSDDNSGKLSALLYSYFEWDKFTGSNDLCRIQVQ